MKNHEEFMQAVYAKADVKRKQIKRRNTMIRHASVSFVCTFIVAIAIVPVYRMFNAQPPVSPVTPATYALDGSESLGVGVDPIMNGYELALPQAARMVVVNNTANHVELHDMEDMSDVVDVLSAGYTESGEPTSLPMVPHFEGAVMIDSVDGLLEFLAGLPQTVPLLQQLMEEYNDEFFQENVLSALPVGVGEPLFFFTAGQDEYPLEDYPYDEYPGTTRTTASNRWDANVHSDILLLLLVPMSID